MSDFETIINTRRSIRKYKNKEVSDEDILKILKAGMQAPGSRLNSEPWEFVVIKNKDKLSKLAEIKPRVKTSPVAILLVANIERAFYKLHWQQDMAAAAENMLLEAVEGRGREHVGIVFAQPLVDFQFALRIPLGAFAFIFQFANSPNAVQQIGRAHV